MLLDAFAVVEEMRKKHPQHFATLTKVPTTFRRNYKKKLVHNQSQHCCVNISTATHISITAAYNIVTVIHAQYTLCTCTMVLFLHTGKALAFMGTGDLTLL